MSSSNTHTDWDVAVKATFKQHSTFLRSPILEKRLDYLQEQYRKDEVFRQHVFSLETFINTCANNVTRRKSLIGYVIEYGDEKNMIYLADDQKILETEEWATLPPDETLRVKFLEEKIIDYVNLKLRALKRAADQGSEFWIDRFRSVIAIADDIITFPICTAEKLDYMFKGGGPRQNELPVVGIYNQSSS